MTNDERRQEILNVLNNKKEPISATTLAKQFGVTRQIVVGDIALLRASGIVIRAEHKGYVLTKANEGGFKQRIVCKHSREGLKDELYCIVDNGASVLDVIVEHPIYGQISGELNLSSRFDVDQFVRKLEKNSTAQLSDLTGGVHIHTIVASDEECLKRAISALSDLGVLVTM